MEPFEALNRKVHAAGEAATRPQHDPWTRWRKTFNACKETYWREARVPEAYLLSGLQRMYQRACELHGQHLIDWRKLDEAAAHELYYHFNRGRQFQNAEAAIAKCWWNLVAERPERIKAR